MTSFEDGSRRRNLGVHLVNVDVARGPGTWLLESLSTPGIADLRTAAYLVAIERVAESYLERGVFP